MGYFGSVALLLIVYVLFKSGDGDTRGLLDLPVAGGQNVRAAMLTAAAWFILFALPVFIVVPHPKPPPQDRRQAIGFFGAYRQLWSEVVGEWRRDRNVVFYLLASAVFRDGLTGVFAFGAVLGVSVYGISDANVLLFGVSASVIAAVGALLGGLLDDRLGSKPVIVGSLTSMIVVAIVLMTLSGPVAFWVCGLLLCLSIGPTLSSARTLMLRLSVEGKEGVAFGLYTTTGRAVSFLAPTLISLFIDWFGTVRAGIGGLLVVLALGLGGHGGGARTAPGSGALAHRGADRQAVTGVRLHLNPVDRHRAGDLAAHVDDRHACRILSRTGQLHFLAPRQHDVELRLQHAARVDIGDVDRPTGSGDLIDHRVGRSGGRRLAGRGGARCVGTGTIGGSGRSVVVVDGVRVVVVVGSGIAGGATTVSCFELLATTNAITRPTTSSTASAATTHSQRGDLGDGGPSGGSPGGYGRTVLAGPVLASAVRVVAVGRVRRQLPRRVGTPEVAGRWVRTETGLHTLDRCSRDSWGPSGWVGSGPSPGGVLVIPTSWLQGTCVTTGRPRRAGKHIA